MNGVYRTIGQESVLAMSAFMLVLSSMLSVASLETAEAAGPPGGLNVSGEVEVTNDATDPVQSRDVDTPAFHPFQTEKTVVIPSGGKFVQVPLDPLPANTRLVVEYVSAFVVNELPANVGVAVGLEAMVDASAVPHTACIAMPLNLDRQAGALPAPTHPVCGQTVRIYADHAEVFARRPFGSIGGNPLPDLPVRIRLAGHLVDLP